MEDDGSVAKIVRTHGYVGMKQTTSSKTISKGKNVGKANETSYLEQAILEAKSIFKKYVEKGYCENAEEIEEPPVVHLPMLAHDYNKRHKSIKKSFAVQPKLDGIRLIASVRNGEVSLYSRTGKEVTILDHIKEDIASFAQDANMTHIDGEFYTDEFPFEELSGLFRKKKLTSEDEEKIDSVWFHIFDCFNIDEPEMPFSERYEAMYEALGEDYEYLTLVDTRFKEMEADERDDYVKRKHNDFIEEGYEGVMVRNADGVYKVGYRSVDLQKYKEFHDAEYTIVGGHEAMGNDEGTVVFVCENEDKTQFNVRPRGTREVRKQWLEDIENLVGKSLTVRYQELTGDGVPRFPVGIAVRDYE